MALRHLSVTDVLVLSVTDVFVPNRFLLAGAGVIVGVIGVVRLAQGKPRGRQSGGGLADAE